MTQAALKAGLEASYAAKALREEGAILDRVVCVIDRESGGLANLAKVELKLTPLFTMTELKKAGAI